MPETFIVDPLMTDEELIQGINKDTRFVIMDDHTNTEPTGGPNTKDYLAGKKHILDELIKEYSNCIFILDNYRYNAKNCDNMIWCPLDWMCFPAMIRDLDHYPTDWQTKRKYTTNYLGGKNRINRILLEHWLAKNYPLNQLIYSKWEDSDLGMIIDIIQFSKFANKKHIRPRKNLPIKWHTELSKEEAEQSWITRRMATGKKILIPCVKMRSYLALECEPQDITLNTTITAKTWESMIGGNLVLQFGNYEVLELYRKLGLETFADYFDNSHLQSKDRYYQTIGGCENNKKLICDHNAIESLWYDNIPALKHNFNLAIDINHWFKMFEQPMRILCDALKLTANTKPGFCITVPVDRFKHEFKL